LARYTATRIVGLAALGGFTAFGFGALGSDNANGTSTPHSGSAPVTTSVAFTANFRVQQPGQYATGWRANGTADFAHRSAEESVTLPSSGLHALGMAAGAILPGHDQMTLQAKWVAGRAFVTVPPSLSHLFDSAGEVAIPVSAALARKIDLELNQSAVALTYAKVLLGELAGNQAQHRVGSRNIDGVRASGTEIMVTLTELLKITPGLSPTMSQDATTFGTEAIPVTVWIDHKGRLLEVTMTDPGKGTVPSLSGSIQFSHFNDPVTIAVPPANEVTTIPDAAHRLLSGFNLFGNIPLP
jgi:hypothetical protein